LLEAVGVPADGIVSIRVGAQCRQGAVGTDKPYRFSATPDEAGLMKVDVILPIGGARVVAQPGAREYTVAVPRADGSGSMQLRLGIAAASKVEPGDAVPVLPVKSAATRHGDALQARDYLDEHHLTPYIQAMLVGLLKAKPANPFEWMAQQLSSAARPQEGNLANSLGRIKPGIALINRIPMKTGGACVVTGPSGVGKSTLIRSIMEKLPGRFGFAVSHTTRQPRPGERDGIDYHFSTREEMQADIDAGKFIEHAEVHGNLYGTSTAAVEAIERQGMVCLLDIDIQGAESVRRSSLHDRTSYIFLAPPTMGVLERRLRGRGTETEDKVLKRLEGAQREMAALEANLMAWDLILRWEDADVDAACDEFRRFLERQVPKLEVIVNRLPKRPGGACVVTGPSGVGKSTLIKRLMDDFPGRFGFSVSHTTREPRAGEQDGIDYIFSSRAKMEEDIKNGLFIEHAEVHGNLYGTSVAAVESVIQNGKVCLLDIDVQGAEAVRRTYLHDCTTYVFFSPPNMEVLEQRLRGRGTETEERVQKRLAGAKREMACFEAKPEAWDLVLSWKNEDVDHACLQFERFLEGQLASDAGRENLGTRSPEELRSIVQVALSQAGASGGLEKAFEEVFADTA